LRGLQGAALVTTGVAAALASRTADWDLDLALLLLGFAILAELGDVATKRVHLSASFLAIVLSAVLLGPAPAVVIAALVMTWDALRRGQGLERIVSNVSIHAAYGLIAALVFDAVDGAPLLAARDADAVPILIAVYLTANLLNFALVAADIAIVHRQSPVTSFIRVYLPVLPVELAGSLLLVGVAFSYATYGSPAVALIAIIALVMQRLFKTAVQAADRGEQLELRNQQLAALQVGLISTTMKTLALRDHMTARHSAAVARYSRETARALGLSERDQDLVHIAGLFHDIGKFIFPDSILLADRRLTDEEYEIVKRHPEVGADLIAEIDGYGPVAEIVRFHHERIDGRGYPSGLCGDAIPLASRILAVADVYDVITARDTYRTPVSMREAFAELRRVAGTQLDAHVVEVFIDLMEHSGVMFQHSSAADFEAELALERRVRDYAAPAIAA
jgi:putative nucleotidyltransferase with HDIG domain